MSINSIRDCTCDRANEVPDELADPRLLRVEIGARLVDVGDFSVVLFCGCLCVLVFFATTFSAGGRLGRVLEVLRIVLFVVRLWTALREISAEVMRILYACTYIPQEQSRQTLLGPYQKHSFATLAVETHCAAVPLAFILVILVVVLFFILVATVLCILFVLCTKAVTSMVGGHGRSAL
jgi:hypothetical protein